VNRKLIVASIATAALGASASQAVGADKTKSCGNSGSAITGIKATRTTCSTAKKVVRADVEGKKFDGWKCKGKVFTGGSHVTCTHGGGGKVTFTVRQG
jgi:hypothetical protein